MKYVFLGIILLIAILTVPHIYTDWRSGKEIQQKIAASADQLNTVGHAFRNRSGRVEVESVMRALTKQDLNFLLKRRSKPSDLVCIWNWGGVHQATASALGIDRQHHFANSYLVGYQPFRTNRVWVPLYTLALRKRYEYDHLQYSGLKEVWQNSQQAYYYTRGDCEDHAIILADWLIAMGLDARVVLGTYKKSGHAWVVFVINGKEYLLEATSKKRIRSMGAIPAAALMVDYHPAYQFNRDKFWVNTGSQFTTRYTGRPWKLKSRFVDTISTVPAKS